MRTALRVKLPDHQGKYREFSRFRLPWGRVAAEKASSSVGFSSKFPTQPNRELFWRNREFFRRNREFDPQNRESLFTSIFPDYNTQTVRILRTGHGAYRRIFSAVPPIKRSSQVSLSTHRHDYKVNLELAHQLPDHFVNDAKVEFGTAFWVELRRFFLETLELARCRLTVLLEQFCGLIPTRDPVR